MKFPHTLDVIAMLRMLVSHETLLMFANVAAASAGLHAHEPDQGVKAC
jgi:hypothetical protein